MYPPPLIYYNNSYEKYKMDMIMSYYLLEKLNKKETDKKTYVSPKRDNMFPQGGQQYHWCLCVTCNLKESK